MTLFSERRHSENPSGGQESLEVSALATPVPAEARPRKPINTYTNVPTYGYTGIPI